MRRSFSIIPEKVSLFQSTHSLRSATPTLRWRKRRKPCFNPRTPCGVRPFVGHETVPHDLFQSTHSLRSATPTLRWRKRRKPCFNPRTPCGVRPFVGHETVPHDLFQSTHSLRSATNDLAAGRERQVVSIHALLAECDSELNQ